MEEKTQSPIVRVFAVIFMPLVFTWLGCKYTYLGTKWLFKNVFSGVSRIGKVVGTHTTRLGNFLYKSLSAVGRGIKFCGSNVLRISTKSIMFFANIILSTLLYTQTFLRMLYRACGRMLRTLGRGLLRIGTAFTNVGKYIVRSKPVKVLNTSTRTVVRALRKTVLFFYAQFTRLTIFTRSKVLIPLGAALRHAVQFVVRTVVKVITYLVRTFLRVGKFVANHALLPVILLFAGCLVAGYYFLKNISYILAQGAVWLLIHGVGFIKDAFRLLWRSVLFPVLQAVSFIVAKVYYAFGITGAYAIRSIARAVKTVDRGVRIIFQHVYQNLLRPLTRALYTTLKVLGRFVKVIVSALYKSVRYLLKGTVRGIKWVSVRVVWAALCLSGRMLRKVYRVVVRPVIVYTYRFVRYAGRCALMGITQVKNLTASTASSVKRTMKSILAATFGQG